MGYSLVAISMMILYGLALIYREIFSKVLFSFCLATAGCLFAWSPQLPVVCDGPASRSCGRRTCCFVRGRLATSWIASGGKSLQGIPQAWVLAPMHALALMLVLMLDTVRRRCALDRLQDALRVPRWLRSWRLGNRYVRPRRVSEAGMLSCRHAHARARTHTHTHTHTHTAGTAGTMNATHGGARKSLALSVSGCQADEVWFFQWRHLHQGC